MAGEATFLTIALGDWLQAGASFFGVAATIVGALCIERKMRHADHEDDQQRMLEVVTHIKDATGAIRAGLPDNATNYEHYSKSLAMQTALKSAIDMYRFVRADTKIKDLKLWRTLKHLDEALSIHGSIAEKELRLLTTDGQHTTVFDINRSRVAGCNPVRSEQVSGTSRDGRMELDIILSFIGTGDTLVVTRIDRLARSVADLESIVRELQAKGAHLQCLEQPVDTTTPAGKAFLQMLGVFAEFETACAGSARWRVSPRPRPQAFIKAASHPFPLVKLPAFMVRG